MAEDGDIYRPENCKSFIDYVLKNTDGSSGVHFVMADGVSFCFIYFSPFICIMSRHKYTD